MLNEYFIKQSIKEVQIEEFIRKHFPMGDYSRTELQRTPLGVKIIIYTNKPGRIIGRSGKNINEMTEALRNEFNLDNPQLDVKTIPNANLDAKIVAKQITSALEKGYNGKKIGNLTIKRIMDSGAIGAQIKISGKLGGSKSMTLKFMEGFIMHSGYPSDILVDVGFEEALTRPGKIGVLVKIMKEFMLLTGEMAQKVPYIKKQVETPVAEDLKAEAEGVAAIKTEAEPAKAAEAEKESVKEPPAEPVKAEPVKPEAKEKEPSEKKEPAVKKPRAKKAPARKEPAKEPKNEPPKEHPEEKKESEKGK